MNQGASEHIKEAAEVVSQYCDIIAIRALQDWWTRKDNAETVMAGFLKYATVPVVNIGHRSPTTITCRRDYHGRVQNGS
jgi:N-succinyl-L-ornithine transcarbamylase